MVITHTLKTNNNHIHYTPSIFHHKLHTTYSNTHVNTNYAFTDSHTQVSHTQLYTKSRRHIDHAELRETVPPLECSGLGMSVPGLTRHAMT